MIVIAISDVMTLNFFYMVRDEGSWLDIGTSISHFCIASGLCVFVAGLESVSEMFVSGVEFEEDDGTDLTQRKVNGDVPGAKPRTGGRGEAEQDARGGDAAVDGNLQGRRAGRTGVR